MYTEYFAPKLIHENLDSLFEELKEVRERVTNHPKNRMRSFIYFASATLPASTKENPNPPPKLEVIAVNVTAGHNKPAFIKNMGRRGKFPIGFDFVTDKDLAVFKEGFKDNKTLSPAEVMKFAEGDPWFEIRKHTEASIRELTHGHVTDKQHKDDQARIRELEERLALAEKKQESKKKSGDND